MKKGENNYNSNGIIKTDTKGEICSVDFTLERLKELLNWESERKEPITPYSITSTTFKGEVQKGEIYFNAKIELEIFTNNWIDIPLFPKDIIIKDVKSEKGKFGWSGNRYLFTTKGEGSYSIELEFLIPFNSKDRKNGFKLYSPGSGFLELLIPEKNITSSLSSALGVEIKNVKNGTKISAFISAGDTIVGWSPKVEEREKRKLDPIVYGEVNTSFVIGEALVRCYSDINYQIYQAGVISFKSIVTDGKVMDITGQNIKDYTIDEKENKTFITIYLNYEASSSFNCRIYYEKNLDKGSTQAELPVISLEDVDRESGYIGISAKSNIELLIPFQNGVTAIDSKELPQIMDQNMEFGAIFSFKYLEGPYKILLDIKKHDELPVLVSVIDYAYSTTLILEDGKKVVRTLLKVRNNSKPFLYIKLPNSASILSAFIDRSPVKPVKGDNGEMMIPIIKKRKTDSNFIVEYVWLIDGDGKIFENKGDIDITLESIDIPITTFFWKLWVPEKYRYYNFKGTVKKVTHFKKMPDFTPQAESKPKPVAPTQNYMAQAAPMPKMKKRSSFTPKISMSTQYASAEGAVFQGTLPVKIDLPETGKALYFEQYFVDNKIPKLKFEYKKLKRLFKESGEVKPL